MKKIIEFLTTCNAVAVMTSIAKLSKLHAQNRKQNFSKRKKKSRYHQYKHTVGEVLLQNTHLFIPVSLISSKYSAIH